MCFLVLELLPAENKNIFSDKNLSVIFRKSKSNIISNFHFPLKTPFKASKYYRFLPEDILFASFEPASLEKWWRITSQVTMIKTVGIMKVVTEDHQTHSS